MGARAARRGDRRHRQSRNPPGADVLYLMNFQGATSYVTVSRVGGRVPANCVAIGKALLSTLPDCDVRRLFPGDLPQMTAESVTSVDALIAQLADARSAGYAIDRDEAAHGRNAVAMVVGHDQSADGRSAISVLTDAAHSTSTSRATGPTAARPRHHRPRSHHPRRHGHHRHHRLESVAGRARGDGPALADPAHPLAPTFTRSATDRTLGIRSHLEFAGNSRPGT